MQDISKIILENIKVENKSLRSYLLDLVKDMDDEKLKRAFDCFASNNFATLHEQNPTPEQITEFLKRKGIDDAEKLIMRIVRDDDYHEDKKLFYRLIKGQKTKLPDSEQFVKSSNVFDLFQQAGFSRDFLMDINELRPSKNTISRGPFEILCDLFITDVIAVTNNVKKNDDNGEGSGDVHTEKCGALEFKGDDARVQGNGTNGVSTVNKAFEEYIRKNFPGVTINMLHKGYFSAVGSVTETTRQLIESGCSLDTYIDILVECMTAQFDADKSDKESLRQFLIKTNGTFFPKDLNIRYAMKKANRRKNATLISTGKLDAKDFNFSTLWGVIDMYFYHKKEKWPYMIVFDSRNRRYGDYYVLDGKKCNSFDDIYDEVTNANISFTGYPDGNGLNAAVHIHKGMPPK